MGACAGGAFNLGQAHPRRGLPLLGGSRATLRGRGDPRLRGRCASREPAQTTAPWGFLAPSCGHTSSGAPVGGGGRDAGPSKLRGQWSSRLPTRPELRPAQPAGGQGWGDRARPLPTPGTPAAPQAHLALVHEASDVGPQGGAASTHVLLPRGRPAAARQARVEVPQEGLQGGRAQRLPHPRPCCPRGWRRGSCTVDGTAAGQQHWAGVCRARGPPPFDPASQEAPPLQARPGSSFCLCGKNTPTGSSSVTGTPMRHAFPPEPRKAKLPSQVAGFLPGSLETLSNPCLPGQAAARLDLPPTSRSCETHSHGLIHPCQGRTRVEEHPATPGTDRPAQGPGGSGPPTTHPHLPALLPPVHGLARLQQTERAEATPGGRAGGKAAAGLRPQTLLEAGAPPGLFTAQRSKQAGRAGNGARGGGGRTRKERAPSGKPRRGWAGRAPPPRSEVCVSIRLPQGWARGTPREQGGMAGLVDGCPELCLEGRSGLAVRDGRPDGHTQSILLSTPARAAAEPIHGRRLPPHPPPWRLWFPPGSGQCPGRASGPSPALQTKPHVSHAVTCSREWSPERGPETPPPPEGTMPSSLCLTSAFLEL
ncbi:uncharacterized protein ACBT57_011184 [Dama dama]